MMWYHSRNRPTTQVIAIIASPPSELTVAVAGKEAKMKATSTRAAFRRRSLTISPAVVLILLLAGPTVAGAPDDAFWDDRFRHTTISEPGPDDVVNALVVFNDEVIIGGDFFTLDGEVVNSIARRQGDTWLPIDNGAFGVINAMTTDGNAVYFGGTFQCDWWHPQQPCRALGRQRLDVARQRAR